MSLSNKRIITAIKKLPGSFTQKNLIESLIDTRHSSPKKKGQKKRGKTRRPSRGGDKDISAIKSALSVLVTAGFLTKRKNTYQKKRPLEPEGTILISREGRAVLRTDDGAEFIIRKGHLNSASSNDRVKSTVSGISRGHVYTEVTGIMTRTRPTRTGKLISRDATSNIIELFDGERGARCASPRFKGEPSPGSFLVVRLDSHQRDGLPSCSITASYRPDDESFDFERVSIKNSLPGPYSSIQEKIDIPETPSENELHGRKNFTRLFTVTIDGADSKDFDDAISLEGDDTNTVLYVHIADVSAYVLPGTRLDAEALARGTSYYPGPYVIPMLPERLSNDLCSLRKGVNRYTLTAEIHFNKKGEITDNFFHRGIIKVDHRLTYSSAEEILNSKKNNKLAKKLKAMAKLARLIREKRMKEGSLDLYLPDAKMIFENEKVTDITFSTPLESEHLIEEFMLQANMVVSRALRKHKAPALYRIHEKMTDESFKALRQFLRIYNIKVRKEGNRWKILQEVISAAGTGESAYLVNLAVLKSLTRAYYGITPEGHFGLAFPDYTHFTSPIRRYPDLVVHRCLKSLMDKKRYPYNTGELIAIGEQCSNLERSAQKAERDFIKLKTCRLMEKSVGDIFEAVISGIAKSGFFISLTERPIEGMVPLMNLNDDYYVVNEDDFSITGRKSGKRFRLGDRLTVRLVKVDTERIFIDFEVVDI